MRQLGSFCDVLDASRHAESRVVWSDKYWEVGTSRVGGALASAEPKANP